LYKDNKDSENNVRKFNKKMGRIRDPEKIHLGSWILDPEGEKAPDPGSATLFEMINFC
jgi:hypothetical protein